MCGLVSKDRYTKGRSYRKLLRELHDIDFYYRLDRDGNRFEDGIDFRYRFGYEEGHSDAEISQIDVYPCSVLEMMVALAFRCDEHIMWDPEVGNQTGKWFWLMIKNLGLESYDDNHFDPITVYDIVDAFMERQYEPDGKGGLFYIKGTDKDLREVEIWYQLNLYLSTLRKE